jgi:hypothetical protein
MNLDGEKLSEKLFLNKFGLSLNKIEKGNKKTPDFILLKDNEEIAVCEVKDLEEVVPSKKAGWNVNKFNCWTRKDNAPQKIRTKIHKAYNQLKAYNLPRVIIFVNFCTMMDVDDLKQAINGYLPYESRENPKEITYIFDKSKDSLERIKEEIKGINLYVWIQKNHNNELYFRCLDDKIGRNLYNIHFKPHLIN